MNTPNNQFYSLLENTVPNPQRLEEINRKPLSEINYLICFTPRSGSTLLTEVLSATGVMGYPEEWFNADDIMPQVLRGKLSAFLPLLEGGMPCNNVTDYINVLRRECSTPNNVFGCEVTFSQLDLVLENANLSTLFRDNLLFICLRREDFVNQAISLYKSVNSGLWHTQNYWGDVQHVRRDFLKNDSEIRYNRKEIKHWIMHILQQEYGNEQLFKTMDVHPLRLTYERLIANPLDCVREIATHIGVVLPDDFSISKTRNEKVATSLNKQFKERFIEEETKFVQLCYELRGTMPVHLIEKEVEKSLRQTTPAKPETMNVTPQLTTGIPMPKFKQQKLETIASFCNFLEGGNHPQWPLEIFLEISNVCDLKCAMCPTFSGLNPQRFINLKEEERGLWGANKTNFLALDSLLQHAIMVHCYGYGEPTIHPEFKNAIRHLSQYGVLIDFFTNGMHLDEELCQFLVKNHVFRVTVSFSGTTKVDYENIYLGGCYEVVLENIARLARIKKEYSSYYPEIEINALAFQHQLDHLVEFIDLMADHGVNIVELKPVQGYTDIEILHPHMAVMRPWLEGSILEKARKRAIERQIVFNDDPFTSIATVNNENEVETCRQNLIADSEVKPLSTAVIPISELKATAKQITPLRPLKGMLQLSETTWDKPVESLAQFLDITPLHLEPPCFAPFHTFYVKQNNQIQPCSGCFGLGKSKTAFLGDLNQASGEAIWRASGFNTVQTAILEDRYPMSICKECIQVRRYPKHHAIQYKVGAYTSWFQQVFGQEFNRSLQERTRMLGNPSNREIIEKRKLLNSSISIGVEENQFAVNSSIFTLPKKVKPPYSWVEHIPFAFFLVHTLKPRVLVELGVYVGNSYNAFCQAVSMLKIDTQCYGIDTWRGDEHTNLYDESVYNELFAYQQREYQGFSSLLRMTFDEARNRFADGTIDLLHIDGFHTYEAVKHDFENWLPKVSNQGVVIFHDTEVREHDFGVWRLWEELAQIYPSFNFKHGYGLGVIAVGAQVPPEFLNFLQATNQEPFYRELFARLGHYITVLEQNKTLEKSVPSQHLFAQLFIDTGDGFEERHSIIKTVTGEESQLEFDLSGYDSIKQLRFDPLNTLVIVRIPRIVLIDQHQVSHELKSYEDNALICQADKTLVFDTEDSLIYLNLQNYASPQRIVFSVEYVAIGTQALSQILKLEHDQRQTLEQQNQKFSQDLENIKGKKRTLKNLLHQHQLPSRYLVQLFIDTGAGFSEEQSIIQEVTEFTENEQQFEFDLSSYENLKQLRFDPLNAMTALRIEQIVIVDGRGLTHRLNYQPVNAYAQLGEILVFDTEDSQVLITWPNLENLQKVVIRLQYMAMGTNTYRFILQREQEIIKQQGEQIRYLTQLVQQLRG